MHDQKIIELIRTDNSDKALAALYKHFGMMRKMILSKGGNTEDAEDIFQEALIIFCRKVKEPGFELTAQPRKENLLPLLILKQALSKTKKKKWKNCWKKKREQNWLNKF